MGIRVLEIRWEGFTHAWLLECSVLIWASIRTGDVNFPMEIDSLVKSMAVIMSPCIIHPTCDIDALVVAPKSLWHKTQQALFRMRQALL